MSATASQAASNAQSNKGSGTVEEAKAGASVARLTELWLETRAKDTALALIDATIEAERDGADR